MPADLSPPEFANQLNRLFSARRPDGLRVVTNVRVGDVAGVTGRYIGLLRAGHRLNPSDDLVEKVAAFFRVDPLFFTDAAVARIIDGQLDILAALDGRELHRLRLGPEPDVVEAFAAAAVLLDRARREP